jgi:AmmeMemoRadiSam system protein B
MITLRRQSAAGLFYPDDPDELRRDVDRMVREARLVDGPPPKAMIQPHAGYVYSGPIAATGYRRLQHTRPAVQRVVILGPNHTVPLDSIAASSAEEWETPLGRIPVDAELRAALVGTHGVHVGDRPHLTEHAIEVQLPFLQRVLSPGWTFLPLVVGDCKRETTAAVIDACWTPDTLIVVSSDLSHYHSYAEARRIDDRTIEEIVTRSVGALGPRQACGYSPLRGLLVSAGAAGLTLEILDARNSGGTAGQDHRVVGYLSAVFC